MFGEADSNFELSPRVFGLSELDLIMVQIQNLRVKEDHFDFIKNEDYYN